MAQHGRALIWLSQHRVIKAELLSGMECAPLGKDEASRAHGDVGGWGGWADLIFTASGRGARNGGMVPKHGSWEQKRSICFNQV